MAVAEARAAWQRTANRCFVQEDAKRAPKLACCPPASASSKLAGTGPSTASGAVDSPVSGFVPLNRHPSYSNLPPDSRWWLNLQPTTYGYRRGLVNEQPTTLEAGMETRRASIAPSSTSKEDTVFGKEELEVLYCENAQEPVKDVEENCESLEIDRDGCSGFQKTSELSYDLGSPWIESEKNEPWWRTADRDELASLVAQRSFDLIENCDLPRPQNAGTKVDPYVDRKVISDGAFNPTVHPLGKFASGSACSKKLASVEELRQHDSSTKERNGDWTLQKGMNETEKISVSDPSKDRLLEALRHSQTRAREAEKLAKQARDDKEHMIKLFFRQASHLFAYKQWFQLLQLETVYSQIKKNDQPISALFPVVLPWMPQNSRRSWRSNKAAKGKQYKRGQSGCYDFSKFSVAFALGLSLVSAGLLLGWTVGWMVPTF